MVVLGRGGAQRGRYVRSVTRWLLLYQILTAYHPDRSAAALQTFMAPLAHSLLAAAVALAAIATTAARPLHVKAGSAGAAFLSAWLSALSTHLPNLGFVVEQEAGCGRRSCFCAENRRSTAGAGRLCPLPGHVPTAHSLACPTPRTPCPARPLAAVPPQEEQQLFAIVTAYYAEFKAVFPLLNNTHNETHVGRFYARGTLGAQSTRAGG